MKLTDSKSNTVSFLEKILNGDTTAAHLMTKTMYDAVSIDDVPVHILPDDGHYLDFTDLALWIDPIGKYSYLFIFFFRIYELFQTHRSLFSIL